MERLNCLRAEISTVEPVRRVGRVASIGRGVLSVLGLDGVGMGDRVEIEVANTRVGGEVIALSQDDVLVLAEESIDGLVMGAKVEHMGPVFIAPDQRWLGRIVDPIGRPLDGRPLLAGAQRRCVSNAPPAAAQRRPFGSRLSTGMAVFDTLLPVVRGQRIGLFAGSGVGKSSLLAKFARGVAADVAVIALVGERGRELRDFTENVLGPEGMARAVVVTATSDQSALMRRRCALTATAVAEHFRDQGMQVLLLVDSVTRFAEAHREVALAAGEPSSLRGYPPSTAQAIMALCERSGPGTDDAGDITSIFTVLVAGSDMDEPIADILRGTVDGHVVLDRKIAERGRFPAVDLLRSVSRSLPDAATAAENALISEARRHLGAWDRAEMMIQAGLYNSGSDPQVDRAIQLWPGLDAFIAEDAPTGGPVASFERLKQCLRLA